jgi:hypothetical protein
MSRFAVCVQVPKYRSMMRYLQSNGKQGPQQSAATFETLEQANAALDASGIKKSTSASEHESTAYVCHAFWLSGDVCVVCRRRLIEGQTPCPHCPGRAALKAEGVK